jgi:transcription antitermination factor NusG
VVHALDALVKQAQGILGETEQAAGAGAEGVHYDIAMPERLKATSSSAEPFHEEPWYAIQTRYRFETRIAAQLQNKGVEIFLPLLDEVHQWSDRQKTISLPLFSGYVFVRLETSAPSRASVLRTEGVIGFVKVHGEASPIPSRQIDDLRRLLAQKLPCSLLAFLKVGQRVRIRGGCLHGLEGILAETGPKTLVISIECIQRSMAVAIEGYELELA